MLRNKEFRRLAILLFFIAAAAAAMGFAIHPAAGILAIVSAAAFGTAFFAFTKARYQSIARISNQIDVVLHNADQLYIAEQDEGELSILQSEITKMTRRIREQNDRLKKEKEHLADSLADIAHQMVGAVFLIYNSFYISLNERTHQFGILMSVGATAKQLRNLVLFEGLCIGAVGIPIGVLTGIVSIKLILPIVASNFSALISSTVPLTLSVSAPALVVAAVVSLITILISACIPAKKAVATPVMECIRQTSEIKTESKAVKTSKTAQRIYGLEGTLARKNFQRNKKRYRSVVLSLTLSVVLFVSGSAFGTTLKQLAKKHTVEMDGDISFATQDMQEKERSQLYDKLKTADGVYKSTVQADQTYSCTTSDLPSDFVDTYRKSVGDKSTEKTLKLPLDLQFVEDNIYYDFIKSLGLPTAEYTGQDAKVLIVGMNTIEHTTYFTNQAMDFTLASASGEQAKTINATFVDSYPLDLLPRDSTPTYYFVAVAPWQMKPPFAISKIRIRFTRQFLPQYGYGVKKNFVKLWKART